MHRLLLLFSLLLTAPACSRALSLGEQQQGSVGQPTKPDGTCLAGLTDCGGVCRDLATDPLHCGSCAVDCGNNPSNVCAGGVCQRQDMGPPPDEGCSPQGPTAATCGTACPKGYQISEGRITCTCCTTCPDPSVAGYVSQDPLECAAIFFDCAEPGATHFSNECGCGCLGGRHVFTGQCARTASHTCKTDGDCKTGGCGGELCFNPASGEDVTTCDCVSPPAASCGCVNGYCTWWN